MAGKEKVAGKDRTKALPSVPKEGLVPLASKDDDEDSLGDLFSDDEMVTEKGGEKKEEDSLGSLFD